MCTHTHTHIYGRMDGGHNTLAGHVHTKNMHKACGTIFRTATHPRNGQNKQCGFYYNETSSKTRSAVVDGVNFNSCLTSNEQCTYFFYIMFIMLSIFKQRRTSDKYYFLNTIYMNGHTTDQLNCKRITYPWARIWLNGSGHSGLLFRTVKLEPVGKW